MNDAESEILCDFWEQLQNLILGNILAEEEEEEESGGITPLLVLCPFRNHATSAVLLCQLWCEIQTFSNKVIRPNKEF